MASFSNSFSITESDEEYSISNSLGSFSETRVYNGYGKNDQKTWGGEVSEINGRLEFSKKFLYFTFELERSNVNEMSAPDEGNIVFYNSSGTAVFHQQFGRIGDPWMSTSQSDELINLAGSDKNMLIRIKLPTELIYNKGEITKIAFELHYSAAIGDDSKASKTWNLQDSNVQILRWHKWNDNGWGKDYISRGSAYSNKKIAPKPSYTGSVNIYSKVYGSDNETDCGKKYFTETNGIIKVDINNLKFFSTLTRIPTDLYFEGINKNNVFYSKWIHIADNALTSGNTYKTFNSSELDSFKKVDKVYLCFGGDKINKISCKTFENGFWNSDVPDNVKISFSLTSGTSNKLLKTPERTQNTGSYEMQSILNGEFSLGSEYPFEFSSNPILQCTSCDNSLTQNDVGLSTGEYTMTSSSFKIHYSKNYFVTESSNKINFLSQCKLKAGKYTLKCNIKNKLKTSSNSYEYTFSLTTGKEIKISSNTNQYIVFGGNEPKIQYPNHGNVGGKIIIPNEVLYFDGIKSDNFRIYTTNPTSDEDQKPRTITRSGYGISLHKEYHEINENNDFQGTTLEECSILYNGISGWLKNPNEQKTFYISYILNTNQGRLYTPPFKFILGRVIDPVYDGLKVEDKTIKYFLTDNGSDQIISLKNKKSQNSFIEDKINNNKDFSMSRNTPTSGYAKERLSLIFSRGGVDIGRVPIKIEKQKTRTGQTTTPTVDDITYRLEYALELLKTGQINEINFNPLLGALSAKGIDLTSSPFDLKIVLEYMYSESVSQNLFEINLKNINFSPDVIPIGLRKDGVIINPKEEGNEKLNEKDSTNKKNTFIVNVNNVTKLGENKYEDINGLKISFSNPKIDNGVQTLDEVAYFEIFLDSDGQICFSNGTKIVKPFS